MIEFHAVSVRTRSFLWNFSHLAESSDGLNDAVTSLEVRYKIYPSLAEKT